MIAFLEDIKTAAAYIRDQYSQPPELGLVLGSGLGGLVSGMQVSFKLPYKEIPFFPQATVEGHEGALLLGQLEGKQVAVMAGRFHYYEGYSMQEVTFPIRVLKALGIQGLILSNAAGGMNPHFQVGDLMLIQDHINLHAENPLRGRNDERLGPRFPDMSEPYAKDWIQLAHAVAQELDIALKKGVYAGVMGPNFETRAEYRYLHTIGADAVGMSTVPEVIVARHAGLKVLALSVITDIGIREEDNQITHEDVLAASRAAEPRLSRLIQGWIRRVSL
jgi:purine-nucleoside phosphorylase